jgi:hypothetical protein
MLSTHLCFGLCSGLSFSLSHQYSICIPLLSHLCYMTCPCHPPQLHHCNYSWRIVQAMKLIMQFSPTSCDLISLRPKYSPQHPVLKHPQCQRPSFTPKERHYKVHKEYA